MHKQKHRHGQIHVTCGVCEYVHAHACVKLIKRGAHHPIILVPPASHSNKKNKNKKEKKRQRKEEEGGSSDILMPLTAGD